MFCLDLIDISPLICFNFRCPADKNLCVLVELQVASATNISHQRAVRLTTQAWCKFPLFDDQSKLNTGRWRVKFRTLPIQHDIPFKAINNIPQVGHSVMLW